LFRLLPERNAELQFGSVQRSEIPKKAELELGAPSNGSPVAATALPL